MKIIRARFLVTPQKDRKRLSRIEDAYILFNDKIIEIGKYNEKIGQRLVDQYPDIDIIGQINRDSSEIPMLDGVILPGFVKTHGHDHESTIIGVAKDVPLTVWLDEAVNPFTEFLHDKEGELTDELGMSPYVLIYTKARLDDIQFGITTSLTHHCNFNKYHVDELVEANEIAGTRIFIGVGSQDRHYYERILDSVEESVERLNRYHEKYSHLDRVTIIPGPDQLFSNGPELLKSLKQWARDHDTFIHIHSSEEPKTTAWFRELYGMTPIEYANSIDFLDHRTILAHQVQTTPSDIKIIAERGAAVVHNSLANTILGSGMPPVLKMIEEGVRVAISTDGSGSADSQNMLSAARLASQYQKALHQNPTLFPAEEVLNRVTAVPADILELNAGYLEKGRDADIIIVDLSKLNLIPTRLETVIENLIWASAGNEISYVFAHGETLIENYKFKRLDTRQVSQKMLKLAKIYETYKQDLVVLKGTGANI